MQFKTEYNRIVKTCISLHERVMILTICDSSDSVEREIIVLFKDWNGKMVHVADYTCASAVLAEELLQRIMICLELADENYLSLDGLRNYLPVVNQTSEVCSKNFIDARCAAWCVK